MQLAIFKYQEENSHSTNEFTTVEIDGEPWFRAKQVCDFLGIANARDAVSSIDPEDKRVSEIPTPGGNQNVTFVNESGLYNLIFRSKKPSAQKFKRWVTKEVIPAIRKTGSYNSGARLINHNFVIRFNENWHNVEQGKFSVISELFIRLYGRFEQIGYLIPDKAFDGKEIRPDVSVGKLFAQWLRDYHPESCQNFTYYKHKFPNGLTVDARQYPNELLHLFIKFIDAYWLPKCASSYFMDRDRKALDYLPKLLK